MDYYGLGDNGDSSSAGEEEDLGYPDGLDDIGDALGVREEEDVYDPGVWLEDPGMDFTSIFENDLEWDSMEEAIAWARAIGRPYKITLTTMNLNQVMVKLGCDQAGKPRTFPDEANSKKCNCKFVFMGRRDKFTGKWTLKLKHGIHNYHDLPTSYLGHPYATRPTKEEEGMVRTGSNCFTSPRILSKQMVDKNPKNCTSTKQISNMKQKIRLAGLGELTVCQWTLQFLRDENYIMRKKIQQGSDVIEILMFIHPSSLHLMKLFPYLVVMDCTYNTNPYNMYLMEMVGMTCTNKTFNIGFAFLCNEDTPTYTWILKELRNIYTSRVHTLPTAIMTDRDQPSSMLFAKFSPQKKCSISCVGCTLGPTLKHMRKESWIVMQLRHLRMPVGACLSLPLSPVMKRG